MKLSLFKAFATVVLGARAAWAKHLPDRSALSIETQAVDPCTGITPGWEDSYGDGCIWYEYSDMPGCPNYGDDYEGNMGVANDNCCYCAGTAAPVATPPSSPFPSYPPTVTRSPTTPSPSYPPTVTRSPTTSWPTWPPQTYYPTMVMDPTPKPSPGPPTPKPTSPCTGSTPDWVDVDGDGCEWYEVNDMPGCPNSGDYGDFEGGMGSANDNCCYCAMD